MKEIRRRQNISTRARARRIDRVFLRIMQTLLVCFFVFTLTSMISAREAFQIHRIVVDGAVATSETDIENTTQELLSHKLLWYINRNNAMFYPKDALARRVYETDAHIEHVLLFVEPEGVLNVHIKEYQPAYLWCEGGGESATSSSSCFLADAHGYIYSVAPTYSGTPFLIFRTGIAGADEMGTPIGLSVLPEDSFLRILQLRELIEQSGILLNGVTHVAGDDYELSTNEGWKIIWSSARDVEESALNLLAALREIRAGQRGVSASTTPATIDLRFENKIFYQ